MLAYASPHRFGQRRFSPTGLVAIAVVHALAIGALITAKTVIEREREGRTDVFFVPNTPPPPKPQPADPKPEAKTADPIFHQRPIVDIAPPARDPVTTTAIPAGPGPVVTTPGTSLDPPLTGFTPTPLPVRKPPVFATPRADLEPPYPESKLDAGEQARVDFWLELNADGRVLSVTPIGKADPVFFAAARRHVIAHWRYKPATEDGRPVASRVKGFVDFRLID